MSWNGWIVAAAANGFVAVAAGAFAAHGLKSRLTPEMLAVFEVGARYQMYHALALLAVGWLAARGGGPAAQGAGWFFLAGIVIFSGTLYGLALCGLRWLGAFTPIGGVGFLLGWIALAIAALRCR